MFYGRMTEHRVEKPVYEDDGLGFQVVSYAPFGKRLIHIVEQDRSKYQSNNLNLKASAVVGYTDDKDIHEGYRIDGKYTVTKAFPHRFGSTLYMDGVDDGR